MYICICNALNEDDVKDLITNNEIVCMSELKDHNICNNCTKCYNDIRDILFESVENRFKDEDWYISPKEGCHWVLDE